jgi:transcriptional regulator with XRE-family HTH domain
MDAETERYVRWIRQGLKNGKTQSGLAAALGIAHPQISSLMKGTRQLKVPEIPKIAAYLEQPPPPRKFPLVGQVGAGGSVSSQVVTDDTEYVDGPDDAPFGTVAVDIRGDSLGPNFEGWRAFYANRQEPFEESWLGRLCVVGTADDRVLIKWVRAGQNGYNLISGTGAIEENVTLMWAAPVEDLRPVKR